ncbi:MAG: hypothetical protein M1829_006578 [Trizodia sp. TS-e1964]|nr:MAG: hypothetical protein M1829_006578 [Trizodia sp. TS-e1964]
MSSSRENYRVRKRQPTTKSNKVAMTTPPTHITTPYNLNFEQHLLDNCIYHKDYTFPDGSDVPLPINWWKLKERLARPRRDLSNLGAKEFREFQKAIGNATMESEVQEAAVPAIQGEGRDIMCRSGRIAFRNLRPLTDGTIVPGNPDVYYGARHEQLDLRVHNELSKQIIPSPHGNRPIVPNFFLAVKGPEGSDGVARRQCLYDGSLGARGMQRLQTYGQTEPVFDNTARTLSSVFSNGILRMHTIHTAEPASSCGRPSYYMNELSTFPMSSDIHTFRLGATYYRNGLDWAEEMRNEAIERANELVKNSVAEEKNHAAKLRRGIRSGNGRGGREGR